MSISVHRKMGEEHQEREKDSKVLCNFAIAKLRNLKATL